MYRRLEGTRIIETLQRLEQRIEERFPGSGLGRVSGELLAVANESLARAAYLARPNLALRVGTWALIAVIVYIGLQALLHLNLAMRWPDGVANEQHGPIGISNVCVFFQPRFFSSRIDLSRSWTR